MNINGRLHSEARKEGSFSVSGGFLVAVHLDLKGVQFRPEYLPQLLRDIAEQGANAVLVEYEDVFPFANLDIATDPETAWSEEALRDFLKQARSAGLEVIPLQQCLGHLEYVLCWEELSGYALDPSYPSTLDIFNADARALVEDMLRQVLEAHPDSRYFHLGLDEAFALAPHARERGESVCRWFVDYCEVLCDICEEYGKKPLIWSDILEHHLTPEDLPFIERLRDRVVMCTWDYTTQSGQTATARWGGNHISREWLDRPSDRQAPVVNGVTSFVEQMPGALRSQIAPYREGRVFTSIFQADLWTEMGFETLGTTACRISYDGPVLPYYNWRRANIEEWGRVASRSGQAGIIVSSWARGTSWCWPNYSFDLCWPLIHAMTRALGMEPPPFFPGIDSRIVERLFDTLGRCREDWKREEAVATEMEALAPALRAHHHEWQSVILLARLLALHKRAEFAVAEVEDFWANHRPNEAEWQRRLDTQSTLLDELAAMRDIVTAHFAVRYHGKAFEEWLATLFDIHEGKLRRCGAVCEEKRLLAKRAYGATRDGRYRPAIRIARGRRAAAQ